VVGTWPLTSVWGNAVPFQFDRSTVLVGGSMLLANDSTFVETETWHDTDAPAGSTYDTPLRGTYVRQGNQIAFTYEFNQHVETAELGRTTLTFHTVADGSGDWVYRKP
jgi:hypothetical protein